MLLSHARKQLQTVKKTERQTSKKSVAPFWNKIVARGSVLKNYRVQLICCPMLCSKSLKKKQLKSLVLKVTKSHFAKIELSPSMHFTWFSEHVKSHFFELKCAEVHQPDSAILIVDANLVLKVLKSKQLISAHAQYACLHSAVSANKELVSSRLVLVESGYLTVYRYDYEVNKVPDTGFE